MTTRDEIKVMAVGFIIIRPNYELLRIERKSETGLRWETLEEVFTSISALNRRMNELLDDYNYIEA